MATATTISESLIESLSKLISFNTTTGNNQEIAICLKYVATLIPTTKYDVKIVSNNGVPNLYAKSKTNISPILLNGHIDVVPADLTQFAATIKDDKLFGRGSLDMKGAVAVMIALLQTTTGYDLLLTGDEEIGGKNGMGFLLSSSLINRYDYAITGEPTGLTVATEEKGVMWLDAIFTGKSSHAAKPWEGINPLFKLNKLLKYLKANYSFSKEEWKTSVTPTLIKSENGQNQIAESIKLGIDSRYIPSDDPKSILKQLEALCDKLEILHLDPPLLARPSDYTNQLVALSHVDSTQMHWATDARYFDSTPAVIYGPKGEGMHSSSEYVDLSSLITMYKVLSQLVSKLG